VSDEPAPRKILHVDMDAFYASVEQHDRPELRGRPVVVAWPAEQRGVVCAASYEARKFGVRSALPTARALRLCPQAVLVVPRFDRYREISHQVREIFLRHTPLVEPLSLDEAYLDVTHELTGLPSATATAEAIRAAIRETTGLTASAGVAPNKFLAKIASDWKKPDGLFVIKPAQALAFLAPLPVGRLPGVGQATEKLLAGHQIVTVADLRARSVGELTHWLGRFGQRLHDLALGIDEHPVVPDRPSKSISSEHTFVVDLALGELAPELAKAARRAWRGVEKEHLIPRTVTLKLRTSDFRTLTRRTTPPRTPASAEEVTRLAGELLAASGLALEATVRLVGVGLSNFLDETAEPRQPRLF
jgi:DNA polymerase-4